MTPDDDVKALRKALEAGPTPGDWMLATSNSWRRYVTTDGRSVCEPVTYSERDRHPDLYFKNGGSEGPDAQWIPAASPDRIRRILDRLEAAERDAARLKFEPIASAPKTGETVLLRIPTRWGKRDKWIASSGYWEPRVGGFWVIVNADEAIQRVEPTGWLSLKGTP